jgi:hypothetical protein
MENFLKTERGGQYLEVLGRKSRAGGCICRTGASQFVLLAEQVGASSEEGLHSLYC